MPDMKQIHNFAVKWCDKFRDQNINYIDLVDHYMADDCAALGFEMDCGHAFSEKYGQAANNHEALNRIIYDVTDIPLLGSAIYSQWRYFNHWAYDAAEILEPQNRAWFILALSRLALLSGENPFIFQGTLKKIRIVSNNICYGPMPDPDDEVEQHLTINDEGRVWFSGYNFGHSGERYEKARSKIFKIEKAATDRLLCAIAAYFGNEYDEIFATDIGNWEMELTNTEGTVYKFRGSLCADFDYEGIDLSDLVRDTVGMDDLYVFDRNCKPDVINRIALDYHRVTKIKPKEVPEGATIQLPLEEIKAARQNAVETDATVDLSNVVEEAMAEAVVTAEEETAEKVVEAETEASEEKVAEAETEEPQEEKAPESVETEESQEEREPESAETEQEPVEVEEARESEPAQWVVEETVESEEENAESEVVREIEAVTEVEPEPEKVLRHHLTDEEHRRLFTYFAPIPGMKEQVKEALDIAQKSACEKTSKAGNMIVTGRSGSGKTRFSESLIKALCKERQMEGAKVAYLTAEVLNKKDPAFIVDKLSGGFLAIGHASAMSAETVENLSKAMEFKTNRLTVILEDSKAGIYTLKQDYPEFMEKFDSRIVIPVFTNDELVSFAKTYAKEKGYKVDDIAVLAVYSLIGDNQYEDDPVCVGQVREMMDSAIAKASRLGRRPGKKVAKRHLDVTGRIMLYEKDFNL